MKIGRVRWGICALLFAATTIKALIEILARSGVVTRKQAKRPIVNRTNFRTTAVPISGSGDIHKASTVVPINAHSGTT